MTTRIKTRAKKINILFALLLLLLIFRLAYIQIYCSAELTAGARSQQAIPILQNTGRGIIFDRNMVPLTNQSDGYYYMIPDGRKSSASSAALSALLDRIDAVPAGYKGQNYSIYKAGRYSSAITKKLKEDFDAYVFSAGSRYADNQTAVHLIGTLTEDGNLGASGLEEMYQYRLCSPAFNFSMTGDGVGKPLAGLGINQSINQSMRRADEHRHGLPAPSSLITTIDRELQEKTERMLKEENITGAAVVTLAETGEILAMASAPTYNPNRAERYFDAEDSPLLNRAVSGLYPPGSIFKIITAAAALENGTAAIEDEYTCRGSVTVNGVRMVCAGKPKGHGRLDMKEAFAVSCNCYFAHLASLTGGEAISDCAQDFGLGKRTFRNFPGEEAGNLPDKSEYGFAGLSNLSIGQGTLLITPLQAAQMTAVIASGGMMRPFRISSPVTVSGDISGRRVISQKTAEEIKSMMEEVMKSGTGRGAKTHVNTAGKSGSAEGAYSGRDTVHGWFTGYFPAETPKYVVSVICENGKTGSGSALPVFEKIVNSLY